MSINNEVLNSEKSKQTPHTTDSLHPNEYEKYIKVQGWIIWQKNLFDSEDYRKEVKEVETNPMTLKVLIDGKGYYQVWDRYQEITGRKIPSFMMGAGTFDRPSFILQPLTEEEFLKFEEKNKLSEVFQKSEFGKILIR